MHDTIIHHSIAADDQALLLIRPALSLSSDKVVHP